MLKIKLNKNFDKFVSCLELIWKDRHKIKKFNVDEYYDYQEDLIKKNKQFTVDITDLFCVSLDDLFEKNFKSKKEFFKSVFSDSCYSFYNEFVVK